MIVMGVSGSGKTAAGKELATRLEFGFIDGDDHHPAANIEKMAAGIPLDDEDRAPWLRTLATIVERHHARGASSVLACSALKRTYRAILRANIPPEETFFILLSADRATLRGRIEERRGHYMPATLLDSQLATLEPLASDEAGVTVDASSPLDAVISEALAAVRAQHATLPPGR